MMPVLGRSLLEWHLLRVRQAKLVDRVAVATTTNTADDCICTLAERLGVAVFRGSETDVLSRYVGAAESVGGDLIVRVTSDCPLIDARVIDRTISTFLESKPRPDYVSNRLVQTYPRGMDTEVLPLSILRCANAEAVSPSDREHVTPFVWRQPERFVLKNSSYSRDLSEHRWTVDTEEDFELVSRILSNVGRGSISFTLEDCVALLEMNPSWKKINAHIEQRPF